jgi:hypothetical protein
MHKDLLVFTLCRPLDFSFDKMAFGPYRRLWLLCRRAIMILSQDHLSKAAQNVALREGERKENAMGNMPTSPSVNVPLTTVRQMPITGLEQFVDQAIAIRAERLAPHLTSDENALLSNIHQGLPTEDRDRMHALIEKRDDASIKTKEGGN